MVYPILPARLTVGRDMVHPPWAPPGWHDMCRFRTPPHRFPFGFTTSEVHSFCAADALAWCPSWSMSILEKPKLAVSL